MKGLTFTPPHRLFAAAAGLLMAFAGHVECAAQSTNWTGTTPETVAEATNTDENTVFLYNVKTGKFLNRAGWWGVSAVLSETGLEFTVSKNSDGTYLFKSQLLAQQQGGADNVFVAQDTYLSNIGASGANQFVVDRTLSETSYPHNFTIASVDGGYTLKAGSFFLTADASSTNQNVIDKANAIIGSDSSNDGSVWKIVTLKERKQAFLQASNDLKNNVPATFLIKDNDFSRRSADIESWIGGTAKLDYATNTNSEKAVTTSAQTLTYYQGNGTSSSYDNAYKWTGNVKGAEGNLHQTVKPFRHGWYEVRCHAFTTASDATPVLYASVGGATTATLAKLQYAESAIQKLAAGNVPANYIAAHDLVNSQSNGAYTYNVVVRVYVDEKNVDKDANGYETCSDLTFGVKTTGGAANDWICVDNFELEYLGEGNKNIVLDETQPGIDYINEQVSGKNSTIYLNRSFTADAWNSIVLPFDMNESDIVNIFGSGTKVSKYVGAKAGDKNTIYFEATTSIEAGKLYIIKPTVGEPDNAGVSVQSEKALTLSTMDSEGNVTKKDEKETLTISGKYYTIPNIVFGKLDNNGEAVKFSETVTDTTAQVMDGGSNYTFAGTYVKKMNVIPLNSYRLNALSSTDHTGSENKWVINTGAKAHSLGFRGWLQPTQEGSSAKLSFVIDGVEDETTAIEGITTDSVVKTQTRGIYNLNGQLVSGDATQLQSLPKGLYIVNGKKVVVK